MGSGRPSPSLGRSWTHLAPLDLPPELLGALLGEQPDEGVLKTGGASAALRRPPARRFPRLSPSSPPPNPSPRRWRQHGSEPRSRGESFPALPCPPGPLSLPGPAAGDPAPAPAFRFRFRRLAPPRPGLSRAQPRPRPGDSGRPGPPSRARTHHPHPPPRPHPAQLGFPEHPPARPRTHQLINTEITSSCHTLGFKTRPSPRSTGSQQPALPRSGT